MVVSHHRDTSAAAEQARIAVMRRLGPGQRMLIAAEMSEKAIRISTAGERRRHPELGEVEARDAVLRRLRALPAR